MIISTKQWAAHTHTQSAKVSTCSTLWHFGDWSLLQGGGGATKQNSKVAANPLLVVQNVCINLLRIDNSHRVRFHVLNIKYLKSVFEF